MNIFYWITIWITKASEQKRKVKDTWIYLI